MGAAAGGASMIGGVLNLFGAGAQAQEDHDATRLNREYLAEDAAAADAAAGDSIIRGNLSAGRARMAGSATAARQAVAYSNSGVDASVGTPAAVRDNTELFSGLDAKTIENNATREALGHKRLAVEFRRKDAQLQKKQSNEDRDFFLKAAGIGLNAVGGGGGGVKGE